MLKNSLGDLLGFLAAFSKVRLESSAPPKYRKSLSDQLHSIYQVQRERKQSVATRDSRYSEERAAIDAALGFLGLGLRSNSSVLLSASNRL